MGIIAAATIVARLAHDFGDDRLAFQARRARWLMPLIVVGAPIIFHGGISVHLSDFTTVLVSIPWLVLVGIVWFIFWLRILWRFASLLRIANRLPKQPQGS